MTNEQKQCLLRYLGYYDGDVDGIWGSASKAATKDFQSDNDLSPDGVFGTTTAKKATAHVGAGTGFKKDVPKTSASDFWTGIKYLKPEEFICQCGGKYCKGNTATPQAKLVKVLDTMRGNLGGAMTIVSGVRCAKHNANVGGVSNSRHLSGKAADIRVKGKTADQVLAEAKKHPEVRYAYKINSTNVHVDIA
jgi:hypothetical protein